jgi:hypothetical protein
MNNPYRRFRANTYQKNNGQILSFLKEVPQAGEGNETDNEGD